MRGPGDEVRAKGFEEAVGLLEGSRGGTERRDGLVRTVGRMVRMVLIRAAGAVLVEEEVDEVVGETMGLGVGSEERVGRDGRSTGTGGDGRWVGILRSESLESR